MDNNILLISIILLLLIIVGLNVYNTYKTQKLYEIIFESLICNLSTYPILNAILFNPVFGAFIDVKLFS